LRDNIEKTSGFLGQISGIGAFPGVGDNIGIGIDREFLWVLISVSVSIGKKSQVSSTLDTGWH